MQRSQEYKAGDNNENQAEARCRAKDMPAEECEADLEEGRKERKHDRS